MRVNIPDETDPDYHHHGKHGTVIETVSDDGDAVTGDAREGLIFRVELESGETADFR